MDTLRLTVLAIALAASAASTLNPDPLPEPDDCENPADALVDSLHLIRPDTAATMQDYEVRDLVYGPQGGTMIVFRIGVTGAMAPSCMEVSLAYEQCLDAECARANPDTGFPSEIALRFYEEDTGENADRITLGYFAELPYQLGEGNLARVTVAVGQGATRLESSALLWLGFEGTFDVGAPDAGLQSRDSPRDDS